MLTSEEQRIARRILQGRSVAEIAELEGMDAHDVRESVQGLMLKIMTNETDDDRARATPPTAY